MLLDPGGHEPVPAEALERAARAACSEMGAGEGEISVALLADAPIAELNQGHLGHDGPTDVLSFALWTPGEPVVGDVYVGFEQAARQAAEAGVPLEEELVRLVVHGTLHVLGLDHPEAEDARAESRMYRTQERLVREVLEGKAAP